MRLRNPDESMRQLGRNDLTRQLLARERAGLVSPAFVRFAAALQNPVAAQIYPELAAQNEFHILSVENFVGFTTGKFIQYFGDFEQYCKNALGHVILKDEARPNEIHAFNALLWRKITPSLSRVITFVCSERMIEGGILVDWCSALSGVLRRGTALLQNPLTPGDKSALTGIVNELSKMMHDSDDVNYASNELGFSVFDVIYILHDFFSYLTLGLAKQTGKTEKKRVQNIHDIVYYLVLNTRAMINEEEYARIERTPLFQTFHRNNSFTDPTGNAFSEPMPTYLGVVICGEIRDYLGRMAAEGIA